MTEFVVHGIPGSPYVRAALIALEEKGADWRLAALPFGGHRTPEYAQRHPFCKIPALSHGDFDLYELQAILRYVDRVAPGPAMQPADPRACARMDQLLNMTDAYVARNLSGAVSFPRVVAPLLGIPVDEDAVGAAMPEAAHTVGVIADMLGDGPWMVGAAPTLADWMMAPHFGFLASFEEGAAMVEAHPQLRGWIDRLAMRPSWARTEWARLLDDAGMAMPEAPVVAA